ncbi:hypothetical protein FSO04_42785 [Paraburkholderia madseniana]|uniref:StbB n=1 Tax=Paraburkholderia madseniana TaxID=2599607 RepID=A0A6N6W201_9BURK|nr:hypothetical protein [Paraburkholderia madseniana]KAE8753878.1 hypothetical protein FSO04_42785 [Paraburkholderia madseniana]
MATPATTEAKSPTPTGITKAPVVEPLRILVASTLNNIGKSTLSATLLHPKVGGKFYSVEGHNMDASWIGIPMTRFDASEAVDLRLDMLTNPSNAVVDVGASQWALFLKQMVIYQLAKRFTYAVVVAVPGEKRPEEAINSIEDLVKAGVPRDRIRILLNMVDINKSVRKQFGHLYSYLNDNPGMHFNEKAVIPDLELFARMRDSEMKWADALANDVDYAAEVLKHHAANNHAAAESAAKRALVQELAGAATMFIEDAFAALKIDIPTSNG